MEVCVYMQHRGGREGWRGYGGGWMLIIAWDIGKGLKRGRRERGEWKGR